MKKGIFSIKGMLLLVNAAVLAVPVAVIYSARIYDGELIRRTEAELIAQSAFIEAAYKQAAAKHIKNFSTYGRPNLAPAGVIETEKGALTPVNPQIDLASAAILEDRAAANPGVKADARAILIGKDISPILTEAQKKTLAGIRVLDYNGTVVAGRDELGLSLSGIEEVDKALTGSFTSVLRKRNSDGPKPALSSVSRRTAVRVFTAMPITVDNRVIGAVYMSRTPESLSKTLYSQLNTFFYAAILAIALTLLIWFASAYAITRPLESLIAQAEAVMRSQTPPPLRSPAPLEIELISESMIRMAEAVEKRASYIRDFAVRVSHEFKTPTASTLATVELLKEHMEEMSKEEKEKFLEMIRLDAKRLERLTEKLTELARADMLKPKDESSDASALFALIKTKYEGMGVAFEFRPASHGMSIPAATEMLETIFINLIDNAIANEAAAIRIAAANNGSTVTLTTSDNGRGISEANLEHVFEPFFTTGRKTGGTGLGLTIVKSIVDAHGGTISAQSTPGAETTFSITLPKRPS
ncbi:MAG: HAMP domain-containing histidine kinase [Deltaproteobacteria bacterium]|nr:HAMP domain-containing histidine kinase [Deltaproteobacteria bacterium]